MLDPEDKPDDLRYGPGVMHCVLRASLVGVTPRTLRKRRSDVAVEAGTNPKKGDPRAEMAAKVRSNTSRITTC